MTETPLLIPLTTSLYVPGTLATAADSSSKSASVLVDIGTGFFVEKTPEDGIQFYTGKVEELTKNLLEIEKVVGGKNENLRVIEDCKSLPTKSGQCWALLVSRCRGHIYKCYLMADIFDYATAVLRQKMLAEQAAGSGSNQPRAQASVG